MALTVRSARTFAAFALAAAAAATVAADGRVAPAPKATARAELRAISDGYKQVAGYDRATLAGGAKTD